MFTMILFNENKTYCPPQAEEVPAVIAEILCSSPSSGSNEDLDYEDWDI